MALRLQAGNGKGTDEVGDALGRIGAVGTVPVRRPIQGAKKCAGRQRRVLRTEGAALDALRDQPAHAALVAIALGDDRGTQAFRQRIKLEVRRRSEQLIDQAEHVGDGQLAQALGQRRAAAPRRLQRLEQAIQRPVLAEVEQFVLALEVVIEVAGGKVGGDGDLAHPGGGVAACAKDAGGGAQNGDAALVGAA